MFPEIRGSAMGLLFNIKIQQVLSTYYFSYLYDIVFVLIWSVEELSAFCVALVDKKKNRYAVLIPP